VPTPKSSAAAVADVAAAPAAHAPPAAHAAPAGASGEAESESAPAVAAGTAAPVHVGPGLDTSPGQTSVPGKARHVLAIYDTYEGGLKDVHLRAIARAAPLCHAFDLDLALLGFPATDAAALAKRAIADTNVGDGGRYLGDLVRAGRVLMVACTTKEPPTDWSKLGFPVATTSEPAAGKATDMEAALAAARQAGAARVCLIMGLGKRGLPPSLLRVAPLHLELTGRNVSMETATAMGVMAERLRTLRAI
jgi:hypothetical protein